MTCPSCGTINLPAARFCDICGKGLAAAVPRMAPVGNLMVAPGGLAKNNGMAIAGLVLGIVGVIFGIIPFLWYIAIPAAILALVFGYVGRKQISDARGMQTGKGMTTAAIVLGWVGVGFVILWMILVIGIFTSLSNLM